MGLFSKNNKQQPAQQAPARRRAPKQTPAPAPAPKPAKAPRGYVLAPDGSLLPAPPSMLAQGWAGWRAWRKERADAAAAKAAAAPAQVATEEDHFTRLRAEVQQFDEDKRHVLERVLIFAFTILSYVLPVILAVYVGWEIGDTYGGIWRAGDAFSQTMHIVAWAGELIQASFVIAIAFAARAYARNKSHLWYLLVATFFFLVFIAASGLAQWYVASLHLAGALDNNAGKVGLIFRVVMPALVDIGGAIFLAVVNIKDLKKYLIQLEQKAEALEKLNQSHLRVEEAQEAARRAKQQHDQYMESLQRSQELVNKLQELITSGVLESARRGIAGQIGAPDDLAALASSNGHSQQVQPFRTN